jgi:hypothetical protein
MVTFVSRTNFCPFKDEKSSIQRSEEENHEESAEQDKTYSQELGVKDQEDGDGDLSVNLEYTPSEGTLDLKEDMTEPQKKIFPESTDVPAVALSSFVDSNQQENITKEEENQEQPINDSHHELNKNSSHSQDLTNEGNQEQDSNIPNGEEEEEKKPGEVGTPIDNQEREKEFSREHSNSKQEGDSNQYDDILEDSNQPTQISKMQKDELEQGNQEQADNTNPEMEEDHASNSNKHIQDTKRQNQEGKSELLATTRTWIKRLFPQNLLMMVTSHLDIMGPTVTGIMMTLGTLKVMTISFQERTF